MATTRGYISFSASLPAVQDSIVPWRSHWWLEGTECLGRNWSPSGLFWICISKSTNLAWIWFSFFQMPLKRFSRIKVQYLEIKRKANRELCESGNWQHNVRQFSSNPQGQSKLKVPEGHLYMLALNWPMWNEFWSQSMAQVKRGLSRNNYQFLNLSAACRRYLFYINF